MTGSDLVGLGSAIGAAMLALLPVYQKFREIRREQTLADHEKGVDQFQQDVRSAFSATFANRDSLVIMALSLLILGGMAHQMIRSWHYGLVIDRHYSEFLAIKDLINQRYGETMAQRTEILEILRRLEAQTKK